MTDKEKVIEFLGSLGLAYVEVQDQGLHDAWQEWIEAGVREAPFTSHLGILPKDMTIVGRPSTHWAGIIHEAGHLLCGATVLDRKEQEISWFGWEWAVTQHLGLPTDEFLHENRDYGISWDGPDGWREDVLHLRGSEVEAFFNMKVEEATRLGLVSADRRPLIHPSRRPASV